MLARYKQRQIINLPNHMTKKSIYTYVYVCMFVCLSFLMFSTELNGTNYEKDF